MRTPITKGLHHVGLTVLDLEASADFFISILGWKEVRRNEASPAIFVSDDCIMLTLWLAKEAPVEKFDRQKNIGLHHMALYIETETALQK